MKNYLTNKCFQSGLLVKKLYLLLTVICIAMLPVLFFCCENYVEADQPASQLTTGAVFESSSTANAALVGIYSQLRRTSLLTGSATGLSNQLGHYADELTFYGDPENSTFALYNNSLLASNGAVATLWNSSYNIIYNTNALLEGVASSTKLPVNLVQQLTGEGLFIRALIHSYLVNLYGNIPYITTTDYRQNSNVTRIPIAKVNELIIADLQLALSKLPENDISGQRVRANRFAAHALLARTFLNAGLWAEASNAASAVINQNLLYNLNDSLDSIFLVNSSSTILQLSPTVSGASTEEGKLFIFTAGPPSFTALTEELMTSFEPMDLRKTIWTKAVTSGASTWYHAYKYKERSTNSSTPEYSVILRIAEQYLIRAEARARVGNLIGAQEDLNAIRNRAGLGNTTAVLQEDILEAILKERRSELFTEHGHRFFDLKRFHKLDTNLKHKLGWDSTDAIFPIPEAEILLNPQLAPQNLGY